MRLSPPSDDVMWSRCRVGHQSHTFAYAPVAERWPMPGMYIYDWPDYGGPDLDWWQEYCPAQDVISRAIDQEGEWERHESALFVDILKQGLPDPNLVLDFGCHIGWYTTIAERYGYPVNGYDVNPENVERARLNAPGADVSRALIDERSNVWSPQKMRCVKIDLEGAEQWAVRIIQQSLEYRLVDYLLMEVSPVFNDTYPALMERIVSYGYDPWLIPSSDRDCPAGFDAEPLRALTHSPTLDLSTVAGLHQVDVMFARRP